MDPNNQQPWRPSNPTHDTPSQPIPAEPQAHQPQPQYSRPQTQHHSQPSDQPVEQPSDQNYSVDYLNQIATPAKKPNNHSKLILLILVLLGLLFIVAIAGLLLSNRPTNLTRANELNARIETLTKISKDQHKYLRDNALRATNTSFTIFLTNASADLDAPLKAAGIEKKASQAIATSEKAYATELNTDFEDARLNVVLDRTYARQMAYELGIIESMMRSIYNSSSSTELRGYLESANTNLAPIAEDFSEFATAE